MIKERRQQYWQSRISGLQDRADVIQFIRTYIGLLGREYEKPIMEALLELKGVQCHEANDIIQQTLHSMTILQQADASTALHAWRGLAESVGIDLSELKMLTPKLSDRQDVVAYLQTLLSHHPMHGIWPDVDIAYRIVNLAAHYDITPEDNELYALWDTATTLELPEYTNEERQVMWDKVLEFRRRILL